jgi:hypothetical protein
LTALQQPKKPEKPECQIMADQTKQSSLALIFLAWLIVSVPAGWGVYNTLLGAMKLFTNTGVTQPAPPAPQK